MGRGGRLKLSGLSFKRSAEPKGAISSIKAPIVTEKGEGKSWWVHPETGARWIPTKRSDHNQEGLIIYSGRLIIDDDPNDFGLESAIQDGRAKVLRPAKSVICADSNQRTETGELRNPRKGEWGITDDKQILRANQDLPEETWQIIE